MFVILCLFYIFIFLYYVPYFYVFYFDGKFLLFSSEEPGSPVVRKLIDGIKAKKDTHDLLGILYEIPASDKSFYAADEAVGKFHMNTIPYFKLGFINSPNL